MSKGGSFPEKWIDGTDPDQPLLQVHRYAEGTWIMRQSLLSNWEGPFIYLLAGAERALLIDTGADGPMPLRETVDELIGAAFPLIVCHSHAHGDHLAGDKLFANRPETVIVGHSPEEVAEFHEIANWPEDIVAIELGNRKVEVIPIPGHEPAGIAHYDTQTRLLLTNDTLYPGRLYVRDFPAFRASIDRLVSFASKHDVEWVLGAHIEMPNEPKVDYELAAPTHPNEHQLQLGVEQLAELQEEARGMEDGSPRNRRDHFIVVAGYP